MSYPVSGGVRTFRFDDYPGTEPLIPHGCSGIYFRFCFVLFYNNSTSSLRL